MEKMAEWRFGKKASRGHADECGNRADLDAQIDPAEAGAIDRDLQATGVTSM
jgi:hypothetical protein